MNIDYSQLVDALKNYYDVSEDDAVWEIFSQSSNQLTDVVNAINLLGSPTPLTYPKPNRNLNHLMLDIETLDLIPTASILGIAARFFDPLSGELGKSFVMQISLEDSMKQGLTVDAGTILWWLKQSDAARSQYANNEEAGSLFYVLMQLSDFIRENSEIGKLEVWGNGSVFDCVVTENAYRVVSLECPWNFVDSRDVRTVVSIGKMFGVNFKKTTPFVGVKHVPLDDVDHQISYTVATLKHMWELQYK